MKSKLVLPAIPKPQPASPECPALYRSRSSELVVLFTDLNYGVVVVADQNNSVGKVCGGWIACTDDFCWERLPDGAVVQLSN